MRWGCDDCQPRRKRRLVALAAGGQPNMMLTVTTRSIEGGDAIAEAKRQSIALAELKRRIKRKFKVEVVEWLVVREMHKSGWPHMHVLCRLRYIPQRWLSAQWLSITKSSRVFVQRLKSAKHAAYYVSKYIGKAPAQFGKAKRYWKTRHYDLRPKQYPNAILEEDENWSVSKEKLSWWQARMEEKGFETYHIREGYRAMYRLVPLLL